MDDSSFNTKTRIHSGPVAVQLGCVALLDTSSPQTFINTHALESMKRAGAASAICERHTPPRSWGEFGKSPLLQTSTALRFSVQFFHDDHPTASLAECAFVVPAEAMQHDVLLRRDSWMRFNDRPYRKLAPRPGNIRVLGELTLYLPELHGATAFVPGSTIDVFIGNRRGSMLDSGRHREAGLSASNSRPFSKLDLVYQREALPT